MAPQCRDRASRHLIGGSSRTVEALDALNRLSGDSMTLFVVDDEGRLIGSVTDGDIRRALIAGSSLETPIREIARKDFIRIEAGEADVRQMAAARAARITLLPMVSAGFLVRLIDLRAMRGWLPAAGVLMAGGAGERLRPLTLKTPKPLLKVGDRPIIEHNIRLLREFGVEDIYVTVNYLKEQLTAHLSALDSTIECVEEPRKLGTMGSLSLIDGIDAPHIVVMNSDLLTDINLEALWLKHTETEADLTVAVTPYTVSVPYAIMEHKGDRVEGIAEKPTFNYYANAGIYIMRREVKDSLERGAYLDATDLIERLLREGRRVSQYVMHGRWIDIGSPDDYRHACELMKG